MADDDVIKLNKPEGGFKFSIWHESLEDHICECECGGKEFYHEAFHLHNSPYDEKDYSILGKCFCKACDKLQFVYPYIGV